MESIELLDQCLVRSTRRLINMTESLICRAGACFSVAEAEGFSLIGQRAAALLADNPAKEIVLPARPSTLVYHRERGTLEPIDIRLGFELHAASAQDAVYQCIIAHDIAAKLNIPGICTIDDVLSKSLEFVHLPSRKMLDAISTLNPNAPGSLEDSDIVDAVQNSFDSFSKAFDYPISAAKPKNLTSSGICFIARGKFIQTAQKLAQFLRDHQIPAGTIDIALIRPFPVKSVLELTRDQRALVVLDDELIADQSDLIAGLHEVHDAAADYDPNILYIPTTRPNRFEKLISLLQHPDITADALETAISSEQHADKSIVIGAAPSGQMSRGLLYDLAANLAQTAGFSAFETHSPHPIISTLGYESQRTQFIQPQTRDIDILFLSHPGLIDIPDIVDHVGFGGSILVLGRTVEQASIWPLFTPHMKQQIEQKHIAVFSISASLLDEYSANARYGAYAVHGALLAVVQKYTQDALDFSKLQPIYAPKAFDRLNAGIHAIHEVDRSIDRTDAFDPYFAPQIKLPHLNPPSANKVDKHAWRAIIRNFFVRGQSIDASHHPLPGLSIRPPELNPYLEDLAKYRDYPIIATIVKGNPELQTTSLDTALYNHFAQKPPFTDEALDQFIQTAEQVTSASMRITNAAETLSLVLDQISDNPQFDPKTLAGIRDFIRSLDPESVIVGLSPHTLLDLYVLSVRAARRSRMRDVRAEIRSLVTQLRDALRVDDAYGPIGTSASALNDAFGPAAAELLNTTEISSDLQHRHTGHKQHAPERINRMYQSLKSLEEFLDALKSSDDLIFTYPPQIQVKSTYDRVRLIKHQEPIAIAAGLYSAISQRMVEAFKAMRVARLDLDNAYDPDYHGDILEHFTWQDLSEEELRLMPVICIAETSERIYSQLTELSRIMRSGKPIDVLVSESTAEAMGTNNIPGDNSYNPGFSYLATAYREAVVSQSTLARPAHLISCLNRMNRLLRPALSIVTCPTWDWRLPARVQLEAAHCGRTAPVFQYDPSIGATRVERFNVDGNPQIDAPWPIREYQYTDANGQTHKMQSAFTFAHALALAPGYHRYFRILPDEAWNDELVEISEFLKNPTFDRPRIPFIWGVIDSNLRKCIMTRDVANACIDRMQRWKTLRELSMSTQAQIQLATESRENAHALEIESSKRITSQLSKKLDNAREILIKPAETLTACNEAIIAELNNDLEIHDDDDPADLTRDETAYIEGLAGDTVVQTGKPEPPNAPAPAPALPIPRIDSSRCLSCGACIGINDKIFAFNENDQAIITDPNATIEDVREAAETCPANCIIIE